MANAYTSTSSLANLVQTAYDRMVEFALRTQPLHRQIADKKPAQQDKPGSSVVFDLYTDLATNTGSLTESVDPDAIAVGNPTTVTVTLAEYGAAVLRTRLLNLFSFSDVDPAIADIVAYNLVNSVDALVLNVLVGGNNVIGEQAGALRGTNQGANVGAGALTLGSITSTDTLQARDIRAAATLLRSNSAIPKKGSLYWSEVHPFVSYNLRSTAGSNNTGWRDPHVYSAPDQIWNGEVGDFEGCFVVETPRAFINTGAGSGGINVYYSLAAGQQALAEAVSEEFHVVIGPVVDKLMRFRPIGWYGVAGWSIYRQAALMRIATAASVS